MSVPGKGTPLRYKKHYPEAEERGYQTKTDIITNSLRISHNNGDEQRILSILKRLAQTQHPNKSGGMEKFASDNLLSYVLGCD